VLKKTEQWEMGDRAPLMHPESKKGEGGVNLVDLQGGGWKTNRGSKQDGHNSKGRVFGRSVRLGKKKRDKGTNFNTTGFCGKRGHTTTGAKPKQEGSKPQTKTVETL